MKSELCINIWIIADIGTGLCYNWSIKTYNLSGDEETITKLLKTLAETDYTTVERENFSDNIQTIYKNQTIKGKFEISQINDIMNNCFDSFIINEEKKLPKLVKFSGNIIENNELIVQKFTDDPLYVCTLIMENEFGEMRPYTTVENKIWIQEQIKKNDIKGFERNN